MAAIDTLWLDSMSSTPQYADSGRASNRNDPNPPTIAAFSPSASPYAPSARRSNIIVQRKSPLLAATPPQVTRALAFSHPFLFRLNKLAGLLSWTTDDPWESFLFISAFWAVTLYGDAVIRMAGPVLLAAALIVGIYTRRYMSWSLRRGSNPRKENDTSEGNINQHNSLDEIVENLQTFTTRCNILLDPALRLTDFFLSQPGTSASSQAGLIRFIIRLVLVSPVWIILALPVIGIITTQRVVLVVGTIALTWHSRPARITRAILWRSTTVRRLCAQVTGLELEPATTTAPNNRPPNSSAQPEPKSLGVSTATRSPSVANPSQRPESPGVRFTFTLWENQRRWLGLGWTDSLFNYERAPWTDDHLNPVAPKDDFQLPEVEGAGSEWRWVKGSEWRVEGQDGSGGDSSGAVKDGAKNGGGGNGNGNGWIYYDSKWRNGRRGRDGWGKYTRRRKWYRDAELVEVSPDAAAIAGKETAESTTLTDADDSSSARRRRWFQRGSRGSGSTFGSEYDPGGGGGGAAAGEDDYQAVGARWKAASEDGGWGIGDEARMGLG